MSNILTIHSGHNSTITYYENGFCKFILHEEKFTYIKNYSGFPFLALDYLNEKVDFKKIDKVIFTSRIYTSHHYKVNENKLLSRSENLFSQFRSVYEFFELNLNFFNFITKVKDLIREYIFTPQVLNKIKKDLKLRYKITEEKLEFYDHHLCHCLTPLSFYDINTNNKVLLISFDGEGDFYCSKIFLYDKKKLTLKHSTRYEYSLGLFYSSITKSLGMQPNNHEYKLMGLAAFTEKNKYVKILLDELRKLIFIDKKKLTIKSKINTFLVGDLLKKKFSHFRFDNFAAAAQYFLEEIILEYFELVLKKYEPKTICLSGGLFLNVKLNQHIVEKFHNIKIYIQPTGGDESLGLGAAYNYYNLKNGSEVKPIKNMYYGRDVDTKLLKLKDKTILEKFNIQEFESNNDKIIKIVELLKKDEVVAFVNSRSEWGARSLCNRALLVNPKNYKNFSYVNDLIKKRDFWMPFAPVIIDTWAEKYIKNWKNLKVKIFDSSKFMTTSFDTTPLGQEDLICAIHPKDKTIRAQIISEQDNPVVYKILSRTEEELGIGGLLNTSLNLHGKPLNDTIDHVIDTSLNSKLKYIFINDFMLEKKL